MTTPDQQPNPPQQPAAAIGAEDLLAQRPATIAEPIRAVTPTGGRPSMTTILAAVVVAALMFAGGLLVGHATSASAAGQDTAGGFAGNGRAFGGGAGGAGRTGGADGTGGPGGFTTGQIASIDGSTLTITTSDGKTVKVTTTSSTTVSRTAQSDVASLKAGDTVMVIGPAAADGSVAAQRISEGTGGFGGQGAGARPGATPAPTR